MKIDPKMVAELYNKYRFRAQTGNNVNNDCCCALTIIHIDLHGKPEDGQYIADRVFDTCNTLYGKEYVNGFWRGFDKHNIVKEASSEGYANGVAVREYLTEHGYF